MNGSYRSLYIHDPVRSETLCMYLSISYGSREILLFSGFGNPERVENSKEVMLR